MANNRTFELWRDFMPRRNEIGNKKGGELYSVQVYRKGYFENFNPSVEFEKWAAVEVSDVQGIPGGMESFVIPDGLYAVFVYKGKASEASEFFRYIFATWLPGSDYTVDDRPHFEVLGERYRNDGPDSEEDVWIPVKPRGK